MTVKVPPPNFLDKILNFVGKKRYYRIPDLPNDPGMDCYTVARRESFWRALFRSHGAKVPNGYADLTVLKESVTRDDRGQSR